MTIASLLRAFLTVMAVGLFALGRPDVAMAQDIPMVPDESAVAGLPPGTPTPPTTPAPTSATGATYKPGEISKGNTSAITKITSLFNAVITTAVSASKLVKPEADKLAGGLAVITMVLGFVQFAATRDPNQAWAALFEDLGMLGIFASVYVGYATFAPGFYGWFGTLANDIAGADVANGATQLGAAAGDLYDAFAKAFEGAAWYEYPKLLMAIGPVVIAYGVLSLTSIVFAFFSNIGQLQAAAGIVVGQIAVALGFSSFTRGYFKAWLDFMVSASMYSVVAAILTKLVSGSLLSAIQAGKGIGLSTPEGASYVLDLSLFVFLVSFEIPSIAGMFGGGANASGSMVGKVTKAATMGLV